MKDANVLSLSFSGPGRARPNGHPRFPGSSGTVRPGTGQVGGLEVGVALRKGGARYVSLY